MNSKLFDIIKSNYITAGFSPEEVADYYVFKNAFSVHYVFFLGDLNNAHEKFIHYHSLLEKDFLHAKDVADLHWNIYSIFIFEVDPSDTFFKVKENIEDDLRISRKYVFTTNEVESLPPLYMDITHETVEEGKAWEDEWMEALDESLYQQIMESPKSNLETIVEAFINDQANKAE
jgi:hypothetical protein